MELMQICRGIFIVRGSLATTWNAVGNSGVLDVFEEVGIVKDPEELWQRRLEVPCIFLSSQDAFSNYYRRRKRGEILLTAREATTAREIEKDLCDCPLSGKPHAHVTID